MNIVKAKALKIDSVDMFLIVTSCAVDLLHPALLICSVL